MLPPDSDLSLLVPPGILQIISALTLDAPWCLDAWCPKGITIVAIWLLEALAIFIPCILLVIASAWVPYCHACNTTTLNYFANAVTGTPDDVAELRSQLETGDLDTLAKLPLDEDRGHTECALELCSCRSLALLTVEYVWFGASALGTLDHRRSDVVFQLTLEPPRLEDAMLLRDIRFEEDPRSDEDA